MTNEGPPLKSQDPSAPPADPSPVKAGFFSIQVRPGRTAAWLIVLGVLICGPLLWKTLQPVALAWWEFRSEPRNDEKRRHFYEKLVHYRFAMTYFESELARNIAIAERTDLDRKDRHRAELTIRYIVQALGAFDDPDLEPLVDACLQDERDRAFGIGIDLLHHLDAVSPARQERLKAAVKTRGAKVALAALRSLNKAKPEPWHDEQALTWLRSEETDFQLAGGEYFCWNDGARSRRLKELVKGLEQARHSDIHGWLEALGVFESETALRIMAQRWERTPAAEQKSILDDTLKAIQPLLDRDTLPLMTMSRSLALMDPVALGTMEIHEGWVDFPRDYPNGRIYRAEYDRPFKATPGQYEATTRDVFGFLLASRCVGLTPELPFAGPPGRADRERIVRHRLGLMRRLTRFCTFYETSWNDTRAGRRFSRHLRLGLAPNKPFYPDIPILDRAATRADFDSGRAIFHLEGEGTKAKLKLPATCETGPQDKPTRWLILQAETDKDSKLWLGGISRDDIRKLNADEVRGLRGG